MTGPELLALARKHDACEPALKAAKGRRSFARYCRDYPAYAGWMIATKEFWDSLTKEQRWQVYVAAPRAAIEHRWAWDSLNKNRRWQVCVAAPWAAIYYVHAWDSLTKEQRWQVYVAAPRAAIAYGHAWDSLTPEQQQQIKSLAK